VNSLDELLLDFFGIAGAFMIRQTFLVKMVKRSRVELVLFSFGLASCGSSFDAGISSSRLQAGMSEDQVIAALGQPSTVELSTCGGSNGIPTWSCKIMKFGASACNQIAVFFDENIPNQSFVNNWSVRRESYTC
jgi:hypothetical protein